MFRISLILITLFLTLIHIHASTTPSPSTSTTSTSITDRLAQEWLMSKLDWTDVDFSAASNPSMNAFTSESTSPSFTPSDSLIDIQPASFSILDDSPATFSIDTIPYLPQSIEDEEHHFRALATTAGPGQTLVTLTKQNISAIFTVPESTVLNIPLQGHVFSLGPELTIYNDNVTVVLTATNGTLTIPASSLFPLTTGKSITISASSLANFNAIMALLRYLPNTFFFGTEILRYTISLPNEPNPVSNTSTISITVTFVNDAPSITPIGNTIITQTENTLVSIPGVIVGDPDDIPVGSNVMTVLITAYGDGSINAASITTPGVTVTDTPNGVQLVGIISALNQALQTIPFRTTTYITGNTGFVLRITDSGSLSAVIQFDITVIPTSFDPAPALQPPVVQTPVGSRTAIITYQTQPFPFIPTPKRPAVKEYRIELALNSSTPTYTIIATVNTTTPYTLTNLIPNTAYIVRVTGLNGAISPIPSAGTVFTTAGTVPDSPTIVGTGVTSITSNSITLSYAPPTFTGGTGLSIIGYRVVVFSPNENALLSFLTTSTTPTATGLLPGTTYRFEIYARNAVGESVTPLQIGSVSSFITTKTTAPVLVSAVASNPNTQSTSTSYAAGNIITLTFDKPTNQPSAATTLATLTSSSTLGTLSGTWTSSTTFVITITTASTSNIPVIGQTLIGIHPNGGNVILDAAGTSDPINNDVTLSGTWGEFGLQNTWFTANNGFRITPTDPSTSFPLPMTLAITNPQAATYTLRVTILTPTVTANKGSLINNSINVGSDFSITGTPTLLTNVVNNLRYIPTTNVGGILIIQYSLTAIGSSQPIAIKTLTGFIRYLNHIPIIVVPTSPYQPAPILDTLTPITGIRINEPIDDPDQTLPILVSLSGSSSVFLSFPSNIALGTVTITPSPGTSARVHTLIGPLGTINTILTSLRAVFVLNEDNTGVTFPDDTITINVDDQNNGLLKNNEDITTTSLTAQAVITFVVDTTNAVAPVPVSGQITSSGSDLLVSLDPTRPVRIPSSIIPCNTYFETNPANGLGTDAICRFIDSTTIDITFGTDATYAITDQLFIRSGILKRTPKSTPTTPRTEILVKSPVNPAIPQIQIDAPRVLAICNSGIRLSAVVTDGGSRRTGLIYKWSLPRVFPIGTTPVTPTSTSTQYMDIANTAFISSGTYLFGLTVSNWLGAQNSTTSTVSIASYPAPIISPRGASVITTTRSRTVIVAAEVISPPCLASSLKFLWTINDPTITLDSASRTTTTLGIAPNQLAANRVYLATLTATMTLYETYTASYTFQIQVYPQNLNALINGGDRQIQYSSTIQLDATGSNDPDNLPGALTYTWTCVEPDGVTPCFYATTGAGGTIGSVIPFPNQARPTAIPARALGLGTFTITLTVTQASTGRVATYQVQLTIIRSQAPDVSIAASSLVINPSQLLVLTSTLSQNVPGVEYTYVWTQTSGDAINMTSTTDGIRDVTGQSSSTLSLNNNGRNFFTPGQTYRFEVTVSSTTSETGKAAISVEINEPPSPGVATCVSNDLSAQNQGVAFQTPFLCTVQYATAHVTSTEPSKRQLTYQFFRIPPSGQLIALTTETTDATAVIRFLPQADRSNNHIMIGVRVRDHYQAQAMTYANITINPPPANATLNSANAVNNLYSSVSKEAINNGNADQLSQVIGPVVAVLNSLTTPNTTDAVNTRVQMMSDLSTASAALPASTVIALTSSVTSGQSSILPLDTLVDSVNLITTQVTPTRGRDSINYGVASDTNTGSQALAVVSTGFTQSRGAQNGNRGSNTNSRRLLAINSSPLDLLTASNNALIATILSASTQIQSTTQPKQLLTTDSGLITGAIAPYAGSTNSNLTIDVQSSPSAMLLLQSPAFGSLSPIAIAFLVTNPNPYRGFGREIYASASTIISHAYTVLAFNNLVRVSDTIWMQSVGSISMNIPFDMTTCTSVTTCGIRCVRWNVTDFEVIGTATPNFSTGMVTCPVTHDGTYMAMRTAAPVSSSTGSSGPFSSSSSSSSFSSSSSTGIIVPLTPQIGALTLRTNPGNLSSLPTELAAIINANGGNVTASMITLTPAADLSGSAPYIIPFTIGIGPTGSTTPQDAFNILNRLDQTDGGLAKAATDIGLGGSIIGTHAMARGMQAGCPSSTGTQFCGVTPSATGGANICPCPTPQTTSSSGLSQGAIIGIAVGGGVGLLILCLLIICCIMRRRRQPKKFAAEGPKDIPSSDTIAIDGQLPNPQGVRFYYDSPQLTAAQQDELVANAVNKEEEQKRSGHAYRGSQDLDQTLHFEPAVADDLESVPIEKPHSMLDNRVPTVDALSVDTTTKPRTSVSTSAPRFYGNEPGNSPVNVHLAPTSPAAALALREKKRLNPVLPGSGGGIVTAAASSGPGDIARYKYISGRTDSVSSDSSSSSDSEEETKRGASSGPDEEARPELGNASLRPRFPAPASPQEGGARRTLPRPRVPGLAARARLQHSADVSHSPSPQSSHRSGSGSGSSSDSDEPTSARHRSGSGRRRSQQAVQQTYNRSGSNSGSRRRSNRDDSDEDETPRDTLPGRRALPSVKPRQH